MEASADRSGALSGGGKVSQRQALSPRVRRVPRRPSPRPLDFGRVCLEQADAEVDANADARAGAEADAAEVAIAGAALVVEDAFAAEDGGALVPPSVLTPRADSIALPPVRGVLRAQDRLVSSPPLSPMLRSASKSQAERAIYSPKGSARTLGLMSPRTPRMRQSLAGIKEVSEEDVESGGSKARSGDGGTSRDAFVRFEPSSGADKPALTRSGRIGGKMGSRHESRKRLEAWETKLGMVGSPRSPRIDPRSALVIAESPRQVDDEGDSQTSASRASGGKIALLSPRRALTSENSLPHPAPAPIRSESSVWRSDAASAPHKPRESSAQATSAATTAAAAASSSSSSARAAAPHRESVSPS